MKRTSTKVFFDNGRGQKLAGILDAPTEKPLFYGVFGPCFTCPKETHAAAKTCRALADDGVAMLRFDVTGVGGSEGHAPDTNFTTRVNDLIAAAHFLATEYESPKIMIGHSISGTAALSAVQSLPDIQLLATIGSPSDPTAIIEKFRRNGDIDETAGGATINVLGTPHQFGKGFVENMLGQNVAEDTADLACKLFVFHAPHDSIVHASNADIISSRASAAAAAEKIILDEEATHLFENRNDDAVFVAETIMQWCRMHLR
jgi:putative redox protein